jgi:hypothetical protein
MGLATRVPIAGIFRFRMGVVTGPLVSIFGAMNYPVNLLTLGLLVSFLLQLKDAGP